MDGSLKKTQMVSPEKDVHVTSRKRNTNQGPSETPPPTHGNGHRPKDGNPVLVGAWGNWNPRAPLA